MFSMKFNLCPIYFLKLIKTETQCKLFEEQIKHWEKRCSELEKDLNTTRLKMASESEHWHTIEALFGENEKPLKPHHQTVTKIEQATKDIGCNTDNVPIPAERNLPASKIRKASIELVDKNVSPILSPIKKQNQETSTQTEKEELEMNSLVEKMPTNGIENEQPILTNSEETSKASVEVEIQTNLLALNQVTKSVQTLNLEEKMTCDGGKESEETKLKQALAKLQAMEDR